jgi:WD40 repeat protein
MYSQETLVLPKEEFQTEEPRKESIEGNGKKKGPKKRVNYLKKSTFAKEQLPSNKETEKKTLRPGVVSMFYYEELDYLVSGYEDSKIRVWGYNEESITYIPENGKNSGDIAVSNAENVSSRVAGMTLKCTFKDHKEAVVALACFKRDNKHWLISTGWDRKIILWDLGSLTLHDVFRNSNGIKNSEELAADGIILNIDYSAERNEYGYCSADKMAYIRKFSPNGAEMKLVAVLQGYV